MPRGSKPATRKRRGLRVLALVGAIAVLAIVAEVALRLIIPGIVANEVRANVNLTDDHPVDVELGGSALLYALRGGIGDVTIEAPDVPLIEGLEADARAHAAFSPFNPAKGRIDRGTVSLTVPKDELGPTISLLTQGIADSGQVSDGELRVGRSIDIFGQTVTLSATLAIDIVDGEVRVVPTSVQAAGFDMDADQLADATGSLLDPILRPQVVCVDDRLPRGIALTSIAMSSTGSVTIHADVAPTLLSDPKQQELGTCE